MSEETYRVLVSIDYIDPVDLEIRVRDFPGEGCEPPWADGFDYRALVLDCYFREDLSINDEFEVMLTRISEPDEKPYTESEIKRSII